MADVTYEEQHRTLAGVAGQFQEVGKHIRECLRKIEDLRRRGESSQFAGEISGLIAFSETLQQVTAASLYSGVPIAPAPAAEETVGEIGEADDGTLVSTGRKSRTPLSVKEG